MTHDAPEPVIPPGLARRLAALAAVSGALLGALLLFVRPWYERWGATEEELRAVFPGETSTSRPPHHTRAISIEAPAAQVFAWVSQIGQTRGGFYSYELLEDLVGCEMPDVRHLDPALQQWSVGDKLWMYPPHQLGGLGHATLLFFEPGRALVFGMRLPGRARDGAPSGAWSLVVAATGPSSSRLITRASEGAVPSLLGTAFRRTVFEPLHFAMERRMLEGIEGLAEGRPISQWSDALQLSCWLSSFLAFVASGTLAALGRAYRRRLLAFAASGAVFQIVTLGQPPPLLSAALVAALMLLVWTPLPLRRTRTEPELLPQES